LFLGVLTDWVSFVVDEGYTSYAAQRWREGEWPHRDFFFLWTPGIVALHALLQEVGFSWTGERAAALMASALTPAILVRWAADWGFTRLQRFGFGILTIAW